MSIQIKGFFFKFALKREWVSGFTQGDLEEVLKKRPAPEVKRYEILTEQEMHSLLLATTKMRDKCMIALGLYAGLRNMEICHVLVGHIGKDQDGCFVHVERGKGNKSADVPISESLYTLLKAYAFNKSEEDRMWKMSTHYFRDVVHESALAAGIPKRITVHSLRHTYAYHLAKSGVPVLAISKMLRHGSLAITSVYLDHLTREETARYAPVFPG